MGIGISLSDNFKGNEKEIREKIDVSTKKCVPSKQILDLPQTHVSTT